jgi:hypothetical protein
MMRITPEWAPILTWALSFKRMKQGYIIWFTVVFIGNIFFFLAIPKQCLGQAQGQYGMQGSQEAQDFKAQLQQKRQQFMSEFEKEKEEFTNTLWGLPRDKKILAEKGFLSKQYDKNCAFRKQVYEEQCAFLQEQLNANPNMQPFMKEKMLSRIGQDYEEAKAFYAAKQEEDMLFLDGLLKDKSIDGEELNTKLQEFFKSQEADSQKFLEGRQQKYNNRQPPSGRQ